MSSQLTIKFSTMGDLKENDLSFTPSMVFVKNTSTEIFFPPTVNITQSLISRAVPESGEPLDVFTSRAYFTKFMKYATSKKRFSPISLAEAEKTGVVEHNFNFFKDIFFKRNNRIFIGGKGYNIISSKLDMANSILPKDTSSLIFTMKVRINIADRKKDSFVHRTRLSCSERRLDINEQWEDFFGESFFDDGLPSEKKLSHAAPVMYTSDQGIADGQAPSKLKKLQPYMPGINPGGFMNPMHNPFIPMAQRMPVAQAMPIPSAPAMYQQPPLVKGGKKRKKTKRRKKKIRGTRKANRRRR